MEYAPSPWDNFTSVVADTLNIPTTAIDPSTNFQEIGGTSLNIVSAVLKLQESGFNVTVEQFMEAAGSMEKLFLAATANNGDTATGHHFSLKSLPDVDAVTAQILLTESFMNKSQLFGKHTDIDPKDFLDFYAKLWDSFKRHSFAVVDEHGKLRAVALAVDQYDLNQNPLDDTTHSHFTDVCNMLASVTKDTRTHLNPTGEKLKVLCKFMFGASLDNTAEENVTAFCLIEKELVELAKKWRFRYTIAENISPLTQQLSQYFGCKRYLTVQINQWTDTDGRRPFVNCTDDFILTVDVVDVDKN